MYFERADRAVWMGFAGNMGFIPYSVFPAYWQNGFTQLPAPEPYGKTHGYWFGFFDDGTGVHELDVWYPLEPEDGGKIKVVLDCSNCGLSTIDWIHGEAGLAWRISDDYHLEGCCSGDVRDRLCHDEPVLFYTDLYEEMTEGRLPNGDKYPIGDVIYCRRLLAEAKEAAAVRAALKPRICSHCGIEFQPDDSKEVMCSPECRYTARVRRVGRAISESTKRAQHEKG